MLRAIILEKFNDLTQQRQILTIKLTKVVYIHPCATYRMKTLTGCEEKQS